MAKKIRQIDFTGPSVQDLGLASNRGITVNGNTVFTNADGANADNGSSMKSIPAIAITVDSVANFNNTSKGNTKKGYSTLQFKLIRDYLNAALGDNERVEIKLSVMGQELGINPKTLYKHLKTLRETEFYITKLQYGTEIRRR
jgi:hypothetical protein